jgi:hypothetical protein
MKTSVTVLIVIVTVLQGGFPDTIWAFVGVAVFLAALVIKIKTLPDLHVTALMAVIALLSVISAAMSGGGMSGYIAAVKPLVAFGFLIVLYNVDFDLYEAAFAAGTAAAAIGLVSYSGMSLFAGGVISGRLQGTFQYANAAGLFLGACAFLTKRNTKRARFAVLMEIAMLLTQSVGAIAVYAGITALSCARGNEKRAPIVAEFLLSAVSAALMYIVAYRLAIPVVATVIPVPAFVFCGKIRTLSTKFERAAAPLLIGAAVLGTAGVLAVRGLRPLATYIERIIQIADGVSLMTRKPLGIGAGQWGLRYMEYQTAPYTSRLIHSGYIQLGVDSGIAAISAAAVILVLWTRRRMRGTESLAAAMILCHAAMDISLSFLSIDLLLCMLFVSTFPGHEIQKANTGNMERVRFNAIARAALTAPLLLCVVIAYGAFEKNRALWIAERGNYDEAIRVAESAVFENDGEMMLKTMEWSYMSGAYADAIRTFDNMILGQSRAPPPEAYHIKAVSEFASGDYLSCAEFALTCAIKAPYQEDGYDLLRQATSFLDDDSRGEYLKAVSDAETDALAGRNPLYKYIEAYNQKQ